MKANEFDQKFEDGESILEALDLSQAQRKSQAQRCIQMEFPIWMIDALDREAQRLGVTRQAIIKVWLAERLTMR
jgi:hypothetical protein